jgi:hypothetical protein
VARVRAVPAACYVAVPPVSLACAFGDSPWADAYGEKLWRRSMACAKSLCHTEGTGPEALGNQREVDR